MKTHQKFFINVMMTTACLILLNACTATKGYVGTVQKIEKGKDGYTAYLKDKKGADFDAIFSIPRMASNYKSVKVGDKVRIQGDTIHFENKVRVLAKTVVEKNK